MHTVKYVPILLFNTNNSIKHQLFVYTQFKRLKCSIWPIDRILSDATTLGQSGPGSDGNKGVLSIPQRTSITRARPSNCLASYLWQLLGEPYASVGMQSVYSITTAEWVRGIKKYWFESEHNSATRIPTPLLWCHSPTPQKCLAMTILYNISKS